MSLGLRRINGFSIVEAAVLLVVGSIMIASYSSLLAKKMQADAITTTKDRMEAIKLSLITYFDTNGKLPCAASMEADTSASSFGKEVSTTSCTGAFSGTATAGGVRFGAVPVRSLDLPDEMIADAWGNRFRYAVTQTLATPYVFDPEAGALTVRNRDGSVTIRDKAHYTIASLGPNRKGAYNMAGKPGLACPASEAESYNCSNSTELRVDLTTATASVKTGYDDIIVYGPEIQVADSANQIPSGMVTSFRLSACPSGWSTYTPAVGRIVVGVGTLGADTYTYNTTGGIAKPTLGRHHIPEHTHPQGYGFGAVGIGGTPGPFSIIGGGSHSALTKTALEGGGQPYDNRQPWVTMLYCRKN